ncbi:C40 family peptidase [Adhaeribacter sp. BT258]|uniref:C40 family peptidase n=1 Tax=Adhaeribacter terrigena TaxID=2793070 RepID=A0ABS1BZU5_9BACT|nr:C40 family peptidase [Adhaeribacter terrigena]MBK0402671.1 C40 family peptidase [Adhaeribacter terrigena]
MSKNWQRWTFVGITLIGILSGSQLLAIYENKAPSPKVRKTIEVARLKAETEKAIHDSVAMERKELANALIQAGLQRIGIPYVYGGTSDKGFDCSGFVYHTFGQFNIKVPRSSELMASAGKPVAPAKARRGDILIFTGTNPSVRKPGHVGIVISKTGEPLEFVHASSNGGVKVSKVPGTNYQRRFLEVRRVL